MAVKTWGNTASRRRTAIIACAALLLILLVGLWPGRVAGLALEGSFERAEGHSLAMQDPAAVALAQPASKNTERDFAFDQDRRLEAGARKQEISPALLLEIQALVRDLRDDDIKWNAHEAQRKLRRIGKPAIHELERSLRSSDMQERFLAAQMLTSLLDYPSPDLLEVQLERLAFGFGKAPGLDPWPQFKMALYYLDRFPAKAVPFLERGLYDENQTRRFYSAVLLARSGFRTRIPRIAQILIPHLADNRIYGDANISAHALYRLGPGVLPYLWGARESADKQMRELIDLIDLDLQIKPESRADFLARQKMHGITILVHDPVVEYELGRGVLPSW